ncbi:unnamed protein product [Alopecurus aequalis]
MVYIPTDLVLEILERLPWTSRRRLRLVSRSWRNLVHERTTEMQQCRSSSPRRHPTSETRRPRPTYPDSAGLMPRTSTSTSKWCVLCLCDDAKPGGTITLANPSTGDVLQLPPIPCAGLFRRHNTRRSARSWHQAYSFGYDHRTGLYKVVHVPCFFKIRDTLQVFTLGEVSWREVPAPDAKCKLEAGIVSVNGATYWATDRCERIMAFDHESERVACAKPLPNAARARPICRLMEVQRRLGVAVAAIGDILEVRILDRTRNDHSWVHQYSLRHLDGAPPNFMHGEYVLMVRSLGEQSQKLLQHQLLLQPDYSVPKSECKVVNLSYYNSTYGFLGDVCRTFAYIQAKDALSVYKRW